MATHRKIKEVGKPRLVAALLAEIDASWVTVLAEDVASGRTFSGHLHCEFKVPFESTTVSFCIDEPDVKVLECTSCLGGQRVSFELHRLDGDAWQLPATVRLEDLRSGTRVAFANKMYSAEIVTHRGSYYGFAVDISRDCVAVDVDSSNNISHGIPVKVIVRLVNSKIDVFYSSCLVLQSKNLDARMSRVILKINSERGNDRGARKHERRDVSVATLQLSSNLSVVDKQTNELFRIQNISLGGMTLTLPSGPAQMTVIPGMVVSSLDPELSFLVVWAQGSSFGVRPLHSDSDQFAKWCRFIDRVAPGDERSTRATRRELANLLTQSGLLKGSRRTPFGKELEAHIVDDRSNESVLLLQRRVIADSAGAPVLHATLRRYSEGAWLMADGASFTEDKGHFLRMLQACVATTRSMMGVSPQLPRYLSFIWQKAVRSSGEFAQLLQSRSQSSVFDAAQVSIADIENLEGVEVQPLAEFYREPAEFRRSIASRFSADIFEAIVGSDGSHPVLNGELQKFGAYHRAVTKYVKLTDGSFLLAHRVFTHSIWSTTGVTNSVFVICQGGTEAHALIAGLRQIAGDDIAFGTNDFLLVFDGPHGQAENYANDLLTMRKFAFLLHDLLRNERLSFRDLDAEGELLARVKPASTGGDV